MGQRHADAIGLVAERAFGSSVPAEPALPFTAGRADRFLVVMHADGGALRQNSDTGHAVLDDGCRVSGETSQRLSCDASRVIMTHDGDGTTLLRICDAHHIRHWADGGETKADNLVLLCRRHHRAVHEDGFRICCRCEKWVQVIRPNGSAVPDVPQTPLVQRDAAEGLAAGNNAQGLHIDAWTATPLWRGERLDLDLALQALMPPRQ